MVKKGKTWAEKHQLLDKHQVVDKKLFLSENFQKQFLRPKTLRWPHASRRVTGPHRFR